MGARFVRANGLRVAVLATGPPDGPLALCLHGFPDHPGTFRHLLPALGAAGFHAVAPWLRGYPPTDLGTDRTLDPATATADANALHRALGGSGDAVLVGHDWGALVAARAAAAAPERWRRLVTLAVPPEPVLRGAMRDPAQLRRSAYVLSAVLPGARRRFDPSRLAALWRTWSPGYAPETADLEPLTAMAADPVVRDAMLAWYRGLARAVLAGRALSPRIGLPPQPHLVLHGAEDRCIAAGYATAAADRLPNPASVVEVVPGTGHWLHLERPAEVTARVVEFLRPVLA